MEFIYTFATYWHIAMWVIGSLVVTGALVLALMAIYQTLFYGWGKKVSKAMHFHLWLYQAMRAWERAGHPRPGPSTMTERQKLDTCAQELIEFAKEHGYVLTITTEPDPWAPLAMGNFNMVHDVREARARYKKEVGMS